MKKYIIIANPNSGSFLGLEKIEEIKNRITENGFAAEYYLTEAPGSAYSFLKNNISKFTDVIAAGGDGIINEISAIAKFQNFNLGLIPCGTANVLAKEFNIPENNFIKAIDIILHGGKRKLDVWNAGEKTFLLFISGGLDSTAVENINLSLKKKTGKFAYIYSFFKEFLFFNKHEYFISNNNLKITTGQFFISNIKKYAGDYIINERADYSDGKIELVFFTEINRVKYLSFVLNLLLKKDISKLDYIRILSSDYFNINSNNKLPIQYDGESGLNTPLEIKKLNYQIFLMNCD